jgi:hypothetical protein
MKFKNIISLIILVIVVVSCDEEIVNYDNVNGQTLLKFDEPAAKTFPVRLNEDGSVDVIVSASTVSTVDRSVDISLNEEETTYDTDSFTFESNVVIAAGEYTSSFNISAVDNGLSPSDDFVIVFNLNSIDNVDNFVIERESQVLNVSLVCPTPDDRYAESTYSYETVACTGNGSGGCATTGLTFQGTATITAGLDENGNIVSGVINIPDITGGLYPDGYGSSANPATITESCLLINFSGQPDTVYGGDEFEGSGFVTLDANDEVQTIEFEWTNGYGDGGSTVYTKL